MGGGLGLAAASTFAVASTRGQARDARDRRRALSDDDHGGARAPRSAAAALEMMLFGEKLDAEEAHASGWSTGPSAPRSSTPKSGGSPTGSLARAPSPIRLGLRAFAAQDDLDLEQALPLLRDRSPSASAPTTRAKA